MLYTHSEVKGIVFRAFAFCQFVFVLILIEIDH